MARPSRDPASSEEPRTAAVVQERTAHPPLAAIVHVPSGAAHPSRYRLASGACVIGTAPDCNIALAEPTVSRRHVELRLVAEGVSVRDLGSRNGTFYAGQRVESMILSLGARLTVGTVEVAVDPDGDALHDGALFAAESYRCIVGRSTAMRRLFASLARLEGSLVTVLVTGESGVGKELVAQALHEGSSLADRPFVTVNCGALPRELIASELFGHKRGAFTGAVDARKGAFETADGGTLFLDEIGELPIEVQPMLLRALEVGEVRPVGVDQARRVRVRVIAATNRSLDDEIAKGRFREDLYYRLAVVTLRVPPLRERPDDVVLLAARFAEALGLSEIPHHVLEPLRARAWPGNVRELRNAVQSIAALGDLPVASARKGDALGQLLGPLVNLERPYTEQKDEIVDRFTMLYLNALMTAAVGNQSAAARMSGMDRTYLGRLLSKYGLVKP